MVPFITEHVWQTLIRVGEPTESESVHLSNFPTYDEALIDHKLSESVALSRRLVELGRSARAESKIKIRQPLARALVSASGWKGMHPELQEHIKDELNILQVDELTDESEGLVNVSVKANFRNIGARYGGDVQAIAAAISLTDPTELVHNLRISATYQLSYQEKFAELRLEDVIVTETPKEGWAVASHSGESIALDLTLSPDLIEAGLMREVIRTIQEERKSSGFDITDRIHVSWNGGPEIVSAISAHEEEISTEVLALSLKRDETAPPTDTSNPINNEIGLILRLEKA
jgi:isoleucyl-tRNA synthetase